MRVLELFSGTASFSKVMRERGHTCTTIDNDKNFNPDIIADVKAFNIDWVRKYDVIWMSPPCTTFSMASGNRHWTADRKPKTPQAREAMKLLLKCNAIMAKCFMLDKKFVIENPRARARWFLPDRWRRTVSYCQYGDKRMKPTDIWTNLEWTPRPMCRNGDKCHEPAPRGSKTGTQGLKGAKARGVVPRELCVELAEACER